ncbi:class I SAM-dependent methyltransferase [Actinomadura barringtoniae]|uniref:Class I SAM-dependent methyltransferase n=1 Tax=Actinomadura barringtoniae TaxID=1427535 RepID=A0A939PGE3_9ACTN|nr:class I SAM-dependent methyltransferase [Actinomadura barringtoniae]MBO2449279.1 class I SAM-dependent methyltransferase [Actinomadura barringtoniae]
MSNLPEYYQERAGEYDAIYAKPERQNDLARLHAALPRLVEGRRVLEIAAGTGYWTRTLATSAATVTATDLNDQPLEVARARQYGPAQVTFQTADAYALTEVPGDFDAVFIGFFWSHILREDVPRFLEGLRSRLNPGTAMIALDNRYVPGSSTPISRTTAAGDTYQERTLTDGRTYEILKNFPTEAQFRTDIGTDLSWTELPYYWLATCDLNP